MEVTEAVGKAKATKVQIKLNTSQQADGANFLTSLRKVTKQGGTISGADLFLNISAVTAPDAFPIYCYEGLLFSKISITSLGTILGKISLLSIIPQFLKHT